MSAILLQLSVSYFLDVEVVVVGDSERDATIPLQLDIHLSFQLNLCWPLLRCAEYLNSAQRVHADVELRLAIRAHFAGKFNTVNQRVYLPAAGYQSILQRGVCDFWLGF